MEAALVRKFQQKYRRVKDQMERWEGLQSRLLSQFNNAASIFESFQVIGDINNYGVLKSVAGTMEAVMAKRMQSLERILSSMKQTMTEFHGIVICFEKLIRDGNQLLKGGTTLSDRQMQLRIGLLPSLTYCLEGLKNIYEMHHSEYSLKSSVISALTWKSSSSDIAALRQLLTDQPNIPKDEVQQIFDIIFAEEM
ncbi:hypothetical protein QJS04_geneDACA008671 [Acorus gramineus]|uniref:Uncharacterized protein n=1 Tax=Acorus gramineus TaxID=55184 RepID=A0AAV9ABE9_ACOGR|nr:hypothetical protein QJS04_geneDACA008671 [Acorus gramineus]